MKRNLREHMPRIQILFYVANLERYLTTITYSLGVIIFSMFLGRIRNRIDKV